jgi:hypothetical protein
MSLAKTKEPMETSKTYWRGGAGAMAERPMAQKRRIKVSKIIPTISIADLMADLGSGAH